MAGDMETMRKRNIQTMWRINIGNAEAGLGGIAEIDTGDGTKASKLSLGDDKARAQ